MGIPVMISEIWYNSRFILQQRSRRRAGTEVGMANALRQPQPSPYFPDCDERFCEQENVGYRRGVVGPRA